MTAYGYHHVEDVSGSVIWHGGAEHRIIAVDGGVQCYRCGETFDGDAWQERIADCEGPDGAYDEHGKPNCLHYWMGVTLHRVDVRSGRTWREPLNECAECGERR